MKKILIIFFIFYSISCAPKKSNLEINVDELKKEGQILIQNQHQITNAEISTVDNVKLYPKVKSTNISQNSYTYSNSSNFLKHLELKLDFQIYKQINYFSINYDNFFNKNILYYNKKIIYVDDYSNLFILDDNLKLLKKIQIHKKKEFNKYPLKFSLLINENKLFISDNLGFITAYDLLNYSLVWRNSLNVPFFSNLVIYNNDIYVTNSNGKLYSFNKDSGNQNWSFETGSGSLKSYEAFKISVNSDRLVFSNDLGVLFCINLRSQTIMWSVNLPQSLLNIDTGFLEVTNLVIADDMLFVSSNLGQIISYNVTNGNINWSYNINHTKTPIVNPTSIFLIDNDGFFTILNKSNGQILFKKKITDLLLNSKANLKNLKLNNIFLGSNKIYITTQNGYIFIIESFNLNNIKYKKISDSINSNLAIDNNQIFFIGNKDQIYKIK